MCSRVSALEVFVASKGPDEQLGGEKKVGLWDLIFPFVFVEFPGAPEAFGSDKASGKGLRSGASCLEVLQKRHSAIKGGNAPIWDD